MAMGGGVAGGPYAAAVWRGGGTGMINVELVT